MKVFIASSREATSVLAWVSSCVKACGHSAVPWNRPGLFLPGTYTLPRLIEISQAVEAAIFIFSPDDHVWYRDEFTPQARDNVLIEYGLFAGSLGPGRAIICRHGKPRTPVDVAGLTHIDVSPGARDRARLELQRWLGELANESSAYGEASPMSQAISAILAVGAQSLNRSEAPCVVRGMCHMFERTVLCPIGHYFPGLMNYDWNVAIPCTDETAGTIRIVEALYKRGIVKKNIDAAAREKYPETVRHRIRQDIASVVAAPLLGNAVTPLGTVAFDSNRSLEEMGWNDPAIDEVLQWVAGAAVRVLQLRKKGRL